MLTPEEVIQLKIQLYKEFQVKVKNEINSNLSKVAEKGGKGLLNFNMELISGIIVESLIIVSSQTGETPDNVLDHITEMTKKILDKVYGINLNNMHSNIKNKNTVH